MHRTRDIILTRLGISSKMVLFYDYFLVYTELTQFLFANI